MTTTIHAAVFWLWCATSAAVAQELAPAQRVAKAAMFESRGELAAAEQELRAALATAQGDERTAVERALQQLQRRTGAASAPAVTAQDPQRPAPTPASLVGDPVVQRLIAELDQGTPKVGTVAAAREQLESLGALAVPALCAQLPQLGPFGISNAIGLLRGSDPAIVEVLMTLAKRDPATAQLVAARLDRLSWEVAQPVGERLLAPTFPVRVRTTALAQLGERGADPNQLEPLVQSLLAEPGAHLAIVELLQRLQVPWGKTMLVSLSASPDPKARAEALVVRAKLEPELSQQTFLQALAALPLTPRQRAEHAHQVVRWRPDWVEVACLGLAAADGNGPSEYMKVEWWRQPDAAAPALLALRERMLANNVHWLPPKDLELIFTGLIDTGWRIAPEHEDLLLRNARAGFSAHLIAGMLPDETRALGFYPRMGPQAYAAVGNVVYRRLPWHRLVVWALAALPTSSEGTPESLLTRDWHGLSDEVAAELTTVIARWVAAEPSLAAGNPYQTTPNAAYRSQWVLALIEAVRKQGMPASVLMPLVAAGNDAALSALAEREPVQALDAAQRRHWRSLTILAQQHGSRRHVPRLLEAWRAERDNEQLRQALVHLGRGAIELIELGTTGSAELAIARSAATGAKVEDLVRLLAMLPALDRSIIETTHQTLADQLGQEHAPLLLAALDAILPAVLAAPQGEQPSARAQGAILHADWLLQHLERLAVTAMATRAADIAQQASASATLLARASRLALAHAGTQRVELLRSLLAIPRAPVVAVTLQQLDGAEWASFAEAATAALLRTASQPMATADWLLRLTPAARTPLALAVVDAPTRRTFSPELLRAACEVLTAGKNAEHLAKLQALLDDPRAEVRIPLARALATTFDRRAAQPLLELLKDDDPQVQQVSREQLQRLAEYLQARSEWEQKLK
jgi:hypothetical protein